MEMCQRQTKFMYQRVSKEVLESLPDFLNQGEISWLSSCRSVQYLLKFPGGVKRTYIYSHLPPNFCTNTLLAGLCNKCHEYDHENFDFLKQSVQDQHHYSTGVDQAADSTPWVLWQVNPLDRDMSQIWTNSSSKSSLLKLPKRK